MRTLAQRRLHRRPWWLHGVRIAGLLFVIGFIVQLNSERAYWFYSPRWFTSDLSETLGIAAFYGFAAAGAVWLLGRARFRGFHQIVLGGALFAWTVEGVIVYVLHEGGPFDPFFPAMFAGWHGILSFGGLFYLVRRWLIRGDSRRLTIAGLVYGTVWGTWAMTHVLPDSDASAATAADGPADPVTFLITATLVIAALALGHIVLDRLWPEEWTPSTRSGWVVVGITAAYAAVGFLAIPWGPIRYAALAFVPIWALMRSGAGARHPNLFRALAGRVQARTLIALTPVPLVATALYVVGWSGALTPATLEELRFAHVLLQMAAGGALVIWALVRILRSGDTPWAVRPAADG